MPTRGLPAVNDDSQRLGKGLTMPENTEQQAVENATQGASAASERTFTQSEMDAIIGDRLKRERAKYADYEELRAKAEQYDAAQDAAKSDYEKAVEERDRYKAEIEKLRAERERADQVAKVAAEKGVDATLLARMSGDVEENAAFLKAQMDNRPKYEHVHDAGEVKNTSAPTEIPMIF